MKSDQTLDFIKDLRVIFLSGNYIEFRDLTRDVVEQGYWTYFCSHIDEYRYKKWAEDIDALVILPGYQYAETVKEFFVDYYEI